MKTTRGSADEVVMALLRDFIMVYSCFAVSNTNSGQVWTIKIGFHTSKMEACFFLLACWCFFFLCCSSYFLYFHSSTFWFGFHPFLRCSTMPLGASEYAILDRELQPHYLHNLILLSSTLQVFQHRQHSRMNLLTSLTFLPSRDFKEMPIWMATFCMAKSDVIKQMPLQLSSYSSDYSLRFLKKVFPSAIFCSKL